MSRGPFAIRAAQWVVAGIAALAACSDGHATDDDRERPDARADAGERGRDAAADARVVPQGPRLFGIVAAQVYHDFPSLLGLGNAFKFEAFIDPRIEPGQVASLRVHGPDGFVFAFENRPFSDFFNGYVRNARVHALWYQAVGVGSLQDGRYTIELSLTTGEREERSRDLVSNFALRDFYLAHRDELEYRPSGGKSPAHDTVLRWTPLRELGGPDAYYNAWVSPGTSEYVAGETLRGDSIFSDAVGDPDAGLNRGSSRQGSPELPLPLGPQTWQPEILDANVLDDIDMIIFPPGQHFTAE